MKKLLLSTLTMVAVTSMIASIENDKRRQRHSINLFVNEWIISTISSKNHEKGWEKHPIQTEQSKNKE